MLHYLKPDQKDRALELLTDIEDFPRRDALKVTETEFSVFVITLVDSAYILLFNVLSNFIILICRWAPRSSTSCLCASCVWFKRVTKLKIWLGVMFKWFKW